MVMGGAVHGIDGAEGGNGGDAGGNGGGGDEKIVIVVVVVLWLTYLSYIQRQRCWYSPDAMDGRHGGNALVSHHDCFLRPQS